MTDTGLVELGELVRSGLIYREPAPGHESKNESHKLTNFPGRSMEMSYPMPPGTIHEFVF
jgi:hypothetical protein